MPLRDPLIRTVRSLGAGVIKSCGLFEPDSDFSLFDCTEPSLRNLGWGVADPIRTIRGAGLPVDWSLGDAVRECLPCAFAVENKRSLRKASSLAEFCWRGEKPRPSSSKSALTEALNFGSGTSSSELSPGEYGFGRDTPFLSGAELGIARDVRLEPERETMGRAMAPYEA